MSDYDPRSETGIPTEPVGSLPRPSTLQAAYAAYDKGEIDKAALEKEQDAAVEDSIKHLEATGSPIISDGEQRWSSFATYALADTLAGTGLADNLAGGGQFFAIFADGHNRQLPKLTGGPFRYKTYASEFVEKNRAVGGTIALVKEGDSITIDAKKLLLELNVPAKELAARRKKWKAPKPRYTRGLLAKYMRLVSTASKGAITDSET
jgi:hypothetical protein